MRLDDAAADVAIVTGGGDGGGTNKLANLLFQKQRADSVDIPLKPPKSE